MISKVWHASCCQLARMGKQVGSLRIRGVTIGLAFALASAGAGAGQSVTLRVTATVPPPPCEYPQPCASASLTTTSKVTVTNEQVRYVGSTPNVTRKGDVLTVNF